MQSPKIYIVVLPQENVVMLIQDTPCNKISYYLFSSIYDVFTQLIHIPLTFQIDDKHSDRKCALIKIRESIETTETLHKIATDSETIRLNIICFSCLKAKTLQISSATRDQMLIQHKFY